VLFPFPLDSNSVIPIPVPLPNTHRKAITCQCKQLGLTVDQQKDGSTETGRQWLWWNGEVAERCTDPGASGADSYLCILLCWNNQLMAASGLRLVRCFSSKRSANRWTRGNFPMWIWTISIPISISVYVSFPLLPVSIPKLESYSHSHGIPMGFPFSLGIPSPWSSL